MSSIGYGSALALALMIAPIYADTPRAQVSKTLSAALLCEGDSAELVYGLVEGGSDFAAGYAAYGFGEGTGYKAVVILQQPLEIAGASTSAVIAETENSNSDFAGFAYAQFSGDYRKVVQQLKLQKAAPFNEQSLGRYVSQQPPTSECPPTITLTPLEGDAFSLGCGWCNGG